MLCTVGSLPVEYVETVFCCWPCVLRMASLTVVWPAARPSRPSRPRDTASGSPGDPTTAEHPVLKPPEQVSPRPPSPSFDLFFRAAREGLSKDKDGSKAGNRRGAGRLVIQAEWGLWGAAAGRYRHDRVGRGRIYDPRREKESATLENFFRPQGLKYCGVGHVATPCAKWGGERKT